MRTRLLSTFSRTVMTASSYKYVVVGAGNAAGYAADQFITLGVPGDDVCIIGDEPVAPYERPALSKAVLMKSSVRLPGFHTCVGGGGERHTPEWYEDKGIVLKLGKPVEDIDVEKKSLMLEGGDQVVATGAMMLATGSGSLKLTKTPGHDLNGIHYLRHNDEALALYDALQANVGKTVIVIGGGYIGMEVAAAAVTVGCKVTMVYPEDYLMSKLFTPEIAAYYEKVYKDKGTQLVSGGWLGKEFLGDGNGNVRGVLCGNKGDADDKEVEGSLVIVGVGASVNTTLFKDKLEMDERGGVVVDGTLKTSTDGIYAAGDIASFPLKMYNDRQTRIEHVQHARESAKHAVNAMVTQSDAQYDYLPYFYSRIFDLSWKFYGDSDGECLVCGNFEPKLLAIWVANGEVVKGIFMEHASDEEAEKMKKIARSQPTVDVEAFKKCKTTDDGWALLA